MIRATSHTFSRATFPRWSLHLKWFLVRLSDGNNLETKDLLRTSPTIHLDNFSICMPATRVSHAVRPSRDFISTLQSPPGRVTPSASRYICVQLRVTPIEPPHPGPWRRCIIHNLARTLKRLRAYCKRETTLNPSSFVPETRVQLFRGFITLLLLQKKINSAFKSFLPEAWVQLLKGGKNIQFSNQPLSTTNVPTNRRPLNNIAPTNHRPSTTFQPTIAHCQQFCNQ